MIFSHIDRVQAYRDSLSHKESIHLAVFLRVLPKLHIWGLSCVQSKLFRVKKAENETFGTSEVVSTPVESRYITVTVCEMFLVKVSLWKYCFVQWCKIWNLNLIPGGIMDQFHSHDTVCSRYTVLQTNCRESKCLRPQIECKKSNRNLWIKVYVFMSYIL